MYIHFGRAGFLVGIVLLCVLLLHLWRTNHELPYLIFFSLFWFYLLAVVSVVIFPLHITPGSPPVAPRLNLIPFRILACAVPKFCATEIVGNLLLTIPFGFGLSFIVRVARRHILWIAIAVGVGFEFSQWVVSLIFQNAFRTVDINDAILNATGVLVGFTLFRTFAWIYVIAAQQLGITRSWFFADIYDVARQLDADKPLTPP